jgi:hypothetical protein
VGKTLARQAYHSSRNCMLGREHRWAERQRKEVVGSAGNNPVVATAGLTRGTRAAVG